MFIKHAVPSQSCRYLEVYATLGMLHLHVMRDCKFLYCRHKHNLPQPARLHQPSIYREVNTRANTPLGTTTIDHIHRQQVHF